jgi:NTE family protein
MIKISFLTNYRFFAFLIDQPQLHLRRCMILCIWTFWFALAIGLSGCATHPIPGPTPGAEAEPRSAPPVVLKQPPRIGLALGGGAARGFAHVGVIQVLEEAGIRPAIVTGTSAGSLVAALYASGKSGSQLQQVAELMDEATFTDWIFPIFSRGILRGDALARYVHTQVNGRRIEDMVMPLGIVATDLNNGQGVLFQRGDTATAVRASSAVPAIFPPVKISGREYVDGGLVSPVPVRYARQMGAELIIAVDISSAPEVNAASDTLQILLQTFTIMGKSINFLELRDADIIIRPMLNSVSSADFTARKRSIEAGRAAMTAALPQLRLALEAKSR